MLWGSKCRVSPSIGKRSFKIYEAIVVKKYLSCNHIESSNIQNKAFSKQILTKSLQNTSESRSSCKQMFFKTVALKDFAVFTEKKSVLESLFDKVSALQSLELY